ncbi:MAG: hypothetical protein AAF715_25565 [Myxococcota bacterium]
MPRRPRTISRALLGAAFAFPVGVATSQPGCGGQDLPQDICSWLEDTNNCYQRFANDVGTQCGNDFDDASDPVASATGFFAARDDLSLCIKTAGGQVLFDPPLDITAFPPTDIGFTLLDAQAQECGAGTWANDPQTYSITINEAAATDLGTGGDAGAADTITGGTFSITNPVDTNQLDVSCPGGLETHSFNELVTSKCLNDVTRFVPAARVEFSPGIPETDTTAAVSGYVRLRVEYPPSDPLATGAAPRVVEYFNCLIPAPPPACEDGSQNNDETDIDCGGSCDAKCAEGQRCNVDADCTSGTCGLNGGLRQCLAS